MRRIGVGLQLLLFLFVLAGTASADEAYVLEMLEKVRACVEKKCGAWYARDELKWAAIEIEKLGKDEDKNRPFYLQAKRCYRHYADGIDIWEREEKAASHDPISYAKGHFQKAEEQMKRLRRMLEK